jgi:mono/diheme cytochrome c family protein
MSLKRLGESDSYQGTPSGMPQVFPANAAFRRWILAFILGGLLASSLAVRAQKSASANVTADLPPGAMQAKATATCTECHEARIILQQRLSKAAWTKEVDKMTKWGALVDPADRDALIDYLSTNFDPDRPAYDPQRTAGGSSGKSK